MNKNEESENAFLSVLTIFAKFNIFTSTNKKIKFLFFVFQN